MIIPPPNAAVYTLAPGIDELSAEDELTLDRCLAVLAGRTRGLIVSSIEHTAEHIVIDVETDAGPVLILERH